MEEQKKTLRSGFTTGTCAAAAAQAAVRCLFGGGCDISVSLMTPSGKPASFQAEYVKEQEASAVCGIRKDSGDDPDVTNRTVVAVKASFGAEAGPEEAVYRDDDFPGICLSGGEGVGTVTKSGLSCPIGFPAINPVPRRMILQEAYEARRRWGDEEIPVRVEVSVPEGRELALKTFNPRLGIVGGISILGTSGIVNPMSEDALRATIRLEIRVKAAEGRTLLAVAPGNYGERFLREKTGLSMDSFVKCSNFIGDTFHMLAEEGVTRVLLAGHPGKLIKVAGGILNTHSRYGDHRMEIFSDCAREAGAGEEICAALLPMNTTDEAAAYLESRGVCGRVMETAARRVKAVLEKESGVLTEVMLFSGSFGFLAETAGAPLLAEELRKNSGTFT